MNRYYQYLTDKVKSNRYRTEMAIREVEEKLQPLMRQDISRKAVAFANMLSEAYDRRAALRYESLIWKAVDISLSSAAGIGNTFVPPSFYLNWIERKVLPAFIANECYEACVFVKQFLDAERNSSETSIKGHNNYLLHIQSKKVI